MRLPLVAPVRCGLALFFAFACGAVSINVNENGTPIGTITVNGAGGTVSGNFQATDPLGNAITLAQLAKNLGEDHFNWLQFLTPSINFLGTPAGTMFVDPKSGGQGTLWADTLPWYWDEVAPPDPLPNPFTSPPTYIPGAGSTELADNSTGNGGSQLNYSDSPGGPNPGTLDFTTCLVSIGPGNIYKPLGGFTWQATIGGPGTTISQGPTAGCTVTPEMQSLVARSFSPSFTVPEPASLPLAFGGSFLMLFLSRRRRG